MIRWAIADTGVIVAFLDQRDAHHGWAVTAARELGLPWLTCEAVLAEAWHLLRRVPSAGDQLFGLLASGALRLPFALEPEREAVRALHRKYRDVPMSLADACLVRMAELHDDHAVFTLDAHFAVYRKHGNRPIPLVTAGQ